MSESQYTVAQLNQMSQAEFTEALGEIWEETPKIAERAWHSRPFKNVEALYQAMVAVIDSMNEAEQLALIKAHPDLETVCKINLWYESYWSGEVEKIGK